jgi:hypothetical protein
MSTRNAKSQLRVEIDETGAQATKQLAKWGRSACYLGIALVICVASVVPFLYGEPLHNLWNTFGVGLVVLSLALLLLFLYAAGTTLNSWWYRADLKKIDGSVGRD